MVTNNLRDALAAAEQAKADGLQGLYPSACIVMADFIRRIAYPQRGTPDEHATLQDFANEVQAECSRERGLQHL